MNAVKQTKPDPRFTRAQKNAKKEPLLTIHCFDDEQSFDVDVRVKEWITPEQTAQMLLQVKMAIENLEHGNT